MRKEKSEKLLLILNLIYSLQGWKTPALAALFADFIFFDLFGSPAERQGDKKLVYRLINMFSSTEIFSKRRKIYARGFEGKPELTRKKNGRGSAFALTFVHMWDACL